MEKRIETTMVQADNKDYLLQQVVRWLENFHPRRQSGRLQERQGQWSRPQAKEVACPLGGHSG